MLDLSKYQGHTPGPWEKKTPSEIYPASLEDCRIIFPPLGYAGPIAEVSGEPDARLIADAPQLLAELREARAENEKLKSEKMALETDIEHRDKFTAVNIMNGIWDDLCGRSGYDLGCLDDETQREIQNDWLKIIRNARPEALTRKDA